MKIADLSFSENAVLAIELLRGLVAKIEKPDINYDGSVQELINLLDIAAHSSSREIIQCAQQFLGYTNASHILFFESVGVHLENIITASLSNEENVQDEAENNIYDTACASNK